MTLTSFDPSAASTVGCITSWYMVCSARIAVQMSLGDQDVRAAGRSTSIACTPRSRYFARLRVRLAIHSTIAELASATRKNTKDNPMTVSRTAEASTGRGCRSPGRVVAPGSAQQLARAGVEGVREV